jgi:hypothetical protein
MPWSFFFLLSLFDLPKHKHHEILPSILASRVISCHRTRIAQLCHFAYFCFCPVYRPKAASKALPCFGLSVSDSAIRKTGRGGRPEDFGYRPLNTVEDEHDGLGPDWSSRRIHGPCRFVPCQKLTAHRPDTRTRLEATPDSKLSIWQLWHLLFAISLRPPAETT